MKNNWKITETAFGRNIETDDMYFVEVNNKWLVKIQAESYSQAEHKMLDLYGVKMANAVHIEDREALFASVIWCELVSLEELEAKSKKAHEDAEYYVKLHEDAVKAADALLQAAEGLANTVNGCDSSIMESARNAYEEACRDAMSAEEAMYNFRL